MRFGLLTRGVCVAACAALLPGCSEGPYELASVSGTVTLEGKPLAGAVITFTPQGGGEKSILGPGSLGTTDEDGSYFLETFKEEHGAVVGKHTVKITTFKQEFVNFKKSDEVRTISEEQVPRHYNETTVLTFDVPPGGTSEANFILTLKEP